MIFPEASGPLAGHVWYLLLANQGASMPTLGGTWACTAAPGAWVYKPERGRQLGCTDVFVLFPEVPAS